MRRFPWQQRSLCACVYDVMGVSHALPALLYAVCWATTANATSAAPQADTSALDLLENIQTACVAATEARKAVEDVEKAKKKKAKEKCQHEEQKEEEKAVKWKKTELNKKASEKIDNLTEDYL